jgi:hypothetical protein
MAAAVPSPRDRCARRVHETASCSGRSRCSVERRCCARRRSHRLPHAEHRCPADQPQEIALTRSGVRTRLTLRHLDALQRVSVRRCICLRCLLSCPAPAAACPNCVFGAEQACSRLCSHAPGYWRMTASCGSRRRTGSRTQAAGPASASAQRPPSGAPPGLGAPRSSRDPDPLKCCTAPRSHSVIIASQAPPRGQIAAQFSEHRTTAGPFGSAEHDCQGTRLYELRLGPASAAARARAASHAGATVPSRFLLPAQTSCLVEAAMISRRATPSCVWLGPAAVRAH